MHFHYCLIVYLLQFANCFEKFPNDQEILNNHFDQLYNSPRYVDKTLMIEELMSREGTSSTIMVTCPRRFGKSTVLDMLREFFTIHINQTTGEPIMPIQSTTSYEMFKNLKIFDNKEIVNTYLGKRPVIYMDFGITNVRIMSKQEAINNIRDVLVGVYQKHHYLLQSNKLQPYMKTNINNWLLSDLKVDSTEFAVNTAAMNILRFLFLHHNVKCIVLIDEFDAPGVGAFLSRKTAVFDEVTRLMTDFMNILFKVNSHYIEKGVVVGISYLFAVGTAGKLNNVNIYRFLDNEKYVDYFGITENEFMGLMNKYKVSDDMVSKAKGFYNGYTSKNRIIYNTFSVMKYITHLPNDPAAYWFETESFLNFRILLRNPTLETKIKQLLFSDTGVYFQKFSHLSVTYIVMLYEMMGDIFLPSPAIPPENHIVTNVFLTLLLEQGYMKIQDSVGENSIVGLLPNFEIKFKLTQELKMIYTQYNRFYNDIYEEIRKTLINLDLTNEKMAHEAVVKLHKNITFGMEHFYNHSNDQYLNEQVFRFYLASMFELAKAPGYGDIVIEKDRIDILLKRKKQNIDNTIAKEAIIIVPKYDDDVENGFYQILARQYYEKPYKYEKYIIMALNLKVYKNRCVIDMMYQINKASLNNIVKIITDENLNLKIQNIHSNPTNSAKNKLHKSLGIAPGCTLPWLNEN